MAKVLQQHRAAAAARLQQHRAQPEAAAATGLQWTEEHVRRLAQVQQQEQAWRLAQAQQEEQAGQGEQGEQ